MLVLKGQVTGYARVVGSEVVSSPVSGQDGWKTRQLSWLAKK